jgi:hypothetical protein
MKITAVLQRLTCEAPIHVLTLTVMLTSTTLPAFLTILLAYYAPTANAGASYSLTKSYEGSSFFDTDNWSWGGNQTYDSTTNGDVFWANATYSPSLTYINDAGNAIIKVDNTCEWSSCGAQALTGQRRSRTTKSGNQSSCCPKTLTLLAPYGSWTPFIFVRRCKRIVVCQLTL